MPDAWQRAIERDDATALDRLPPAEVPLDRAAILAAKHGRDAILAGLLARGCAVAAERLIEVAATGFRTVPRRPGHQAVIDRLLAGGVDPLARVGWLDEPLIICCARGGEGATVAALRARLTSPPLAVAAALGEDAAVRAALARDADAARTAAPNGLGALGACAGSALGRDDAAIAARLGRIVDDLLAAGADPAIEFQREVRLSPLILAAWWGGDERIVARLLAAGGGAGGLDRAALRWALEPHQRPGPPFIAIADLIAASPGVDLDAPDPAEHGRTLLHHWAFIGQVAPVRWLLARGVAVDRRDDQGRTALHLAAQRNTATTVVEALLAAGADRGARDGAGAEPLAIAERNRRTRVAAVLHGLAASAQARAPRRR